ncbi:MAG: carboxypeptidase regulatory-like domain-containing protein [Planctomycetota bacterium]
MNNKHDEVAIDALLQEHHGADSPPNNLSATVLERHASGEGAAALARLDFAQDHARPRRSVRMTAAALLLGFGTIIGAAYLARSAETNNGVSMTRSTASAAAPLAQGPGRSGTDKDQNPEKPRLALRVFDHKGGPVQSFSYSVFQIHPQSGARQPFLSMQRMRLEPRDFDSATGTATIPFPAPGSFALLVEADMHAAKLSATTTLEAGAKQSLRIDLDEGITLTGSVTDEAGKPIANAIVSCGPPMPSRQPTGFLKKIAELQKQAVTLATQRRVVTDDKGAFELKRLTPTKYRIDVQHSRYCASVRRSVAVSAGNAPTVDFILQRGTIVHGTVRLGGIPQADYSVLIRQTDAAAKNAVVGQALTNELGVYEMTNRLPAGEYEITVSKKSGGNPFQQLVQMAENDAPLTIPASKDRMERSLDVR